MDSQELANIEGQINDIFQALSNKNKDTNGQSRQLQELTGKMQECKRLIKEFGREINEEEFRNTPDTNRSMPEQQTSSRTVNLLDSIKEIGRWFRQYDCCTWVSILIILVYFVIIIQAVIGIITGKRPHWSS